VKTATPAEAQDLLADRALLLDGREDDKWQAGHAPQARHVPISQIEEQAAERPRNRPVRAACRSYRRSSRAQAQLVGAGVDAITVDGGWRGPHRTGLPLTTSDGGKPRII
jgi:rhodanese-related sulfurtransferase